MSNIVEYQVQGHVGVITLNNPPVNALSVSKGLLQGILDALKQGDHDPAVRVFLLIGGGKNFSGGADITEFGKTPPPGLANLRDVLAYMDTVTKPMVAAIAGPTMGGGLELALGAHYRCAITGAQIGLPEVKLGLLPGAGGTQRLPRLIGAATALDMIVSGDPVSTERAKELGIVDEIVTGDLRGAAQAQLLVEHQMGFPGVVEDRLQHAAVPCQPFQRVAQLALVELALASQLFALERIEHPHPQDVSVDGLVQEVQRAQGQAADMRFVVRHGGHEDDRNVPRLRVLAQTPGHLEAVHSRHHHVEQDQLRPVQARQCDGVGTVARFQHLDTLLQYRCGDDAIGRSVINDQDRHGVQCRTIDSGEGHGAAYAWAMASSSVL